MFLIFNKKYWQMERESLVFGFSWSDEEIDKALQSTTGKIGTKFGVDCYVTKHIQNNALTEQI